VAPRSIACFGRLFEDGLALFFVIDVEGGINQAFDAAGCQSTRNDNFGGGGLVAARQPQDLPNGGDRQEAEPDICLEFWGQGLGEH
jgi:hypothetical protein